MVQSLSFLDTSEIFRLLTGNLCEPIMKWNNAFLSVQEGF